MPTVSRGHPRMWRQLITHVTAPTATICLATVTAGILADSAHEAEGLASRDGVIAADMVHVRTGMLTAIAHVLTFIGSEAAVAIGAICLAFFLLRRRGPRYAILVAVAMAASASITVGAKLAVGRARPGADDRLGSFDGSYSFPSGHALNSAVLLGLVCLLAAPLMSPRGTRIAIYAWASLLAGGIGVSRIYLGYHWTTDVLASWAIAAALLATVDIVDRVLTTARQSGNVQVRPATVDS